MDSVGLAKAALAQASSIEAQIEDLQRKRREIEAEAKSHVIAALKSIYGDDWRHALLD
jgi:hypothetical protein